MFPFQNGEFGSGDTSIRKPMRVPDPGQGRGRRATARRARGPAATDRRRRLTTYRFFCLRPPAGGLLSAATASRLLRQHLARAQARNQASPHLWPVADRFAVAGYPPLDACCQLTVVSERPLLLLILLHANYSLAEVM